MFWHSLVYSGSWKSLQNAKMERELVLRALISVNRSLAFFHRIFWVGELMQRRSPSLLLDCVILDPVVSSVDASPTDIT